MSGIPMIIMEMLGWAGIALGNYAVATKRQRFLNKLDYITSSESE